MDADALVHESRIAVPYKWSAGLVASRFLKTVAERRMFLASRCPKCARVSVPPQKACSRCLLDCEQDVPVGPRGALVAFTEAAPAGKPAERRVYGLIRLDGAATNILHVLEGVRLDELRPGTPVEPVFGDGPQDGVLGVRHFKVAR